jgi:hypothetical protein
MAETRDPRHGALHGIPSFYSPANAIAALLLLGAWIRELSWYAEHEPSTFVVDD